MIDFDSNSSFFAFNFLVSLFLSLQQVKIEGVVVIVIVGLCLVLDSAEVSIVYLAAVSFVILHKRSGGTVLARSLSLLLVLFWLAQAGYFLYWQLVCTIVVNELLGRLSKSVGVRVEVKRLLDLARETSLGLVCLLLGKQILPVLEVH